MSRHAVLDIGTNSVLLLVADLSHEDHRLAILFDGSEITRLGQGIAQGQGLRAEAIERTIEALERYLTRCRDLQVDSVTAVGTAILREASNGREFLQAARDRCGLEVEIISGEEEARLAYMAVCLDEALGIPRDAKRIVMDVGGGSTELIFGREAIHFRTSLNIGAVRLTERFLVSDPPTSPEQASASCFVAEQLKGLPQWPQGSAFVGIGGTIVNLGAIHLGLPAHDPDRLHGLSLTREVIQEEIALFASLPLARRRQVPGLEPKRADVILGGTLIIAGAMDHFRQERIIVSCRGLRYGVLFDRFLRADMR